MITRVIIPPEFRHFWWNIWAQESVLGQKVNSKMLAHAALGLATEHFELDETLQLFGTEEDIEVCRTKLIREAGDLCYYAQLYLASIYPEQYLSPDGFVLVIPKDVSELWDGDKYVYQLVDAAKKYFAYGKELPPYLDLLTLVNRIIMSSALLVWNWTDDGNRFHSISTSGVAFVDTLNTIFTENYKKLSARYPDAVFSAQDAMAKADEANS